MCEYVLHVCMCFKNFYYGCFQVSTEEKINSYYIPTIIKTLLFSLSVHPFVKKKMLSIENVNRTVLYVYTYAHPHTYTHTL